MNLNVPPKFSELEPSRVDSGPECWMLRLTLYVPEDGHYWEMTRSGLSSIGLRIRQLLQKYLLGVVSCGPRDTPPFHRGWKKNQIRVKRWILTQAKQNQVNLSPFSSIVFTAASLEFNRCHYLVEAGLRGINIAFLSHRHPNRSQVQLPALLFSICSWPGWAVILTASPLIPASVHSHMHRDTLGWS